MVPPDRFIPLAEETGLINDIGAWVLGEACRQYVAWQARGVAPAVLAVNVSGVQVERGNLDRIVAEVLHETGMEPGRLELEVTETALMRNAGRAFEILDALRCLGVGVSMDDFGTGYSSMAYLKRFPLTRLKIDRSLVADIGRDANDEAIVAAIVALGRSLGLDVVAEGVERSEQVDRLREMGCHQVQGFLFARPMRPADFEVWLQAGGTPHAG
jgi:EAL domain-containing protein (putative c-di-GMP-specific phosphodiesterase class I)